MALVEARQRQREAELALASARQRLGMRVRARLEGIVTELPARSGQQIAAGAALITIAVDSAAALDRHEPTFCPPGDPTSPTVRVRGANGTPHVSPSFFDCFRNFGSPAVSFGGLRPGP